MAVPKRKQSKQRRNTRYSQWKVSPVTLTECPQCHELIKPHNICPKCGYYDGVLKVEQKEKKSKD
ncbi:MAG: 50S ribosomal protein L32 [Clostridia bacterium]|nr:50S ribosomal protein L32 [Clostridia bacterium]